MSNKGKWSADFPKLCPQYEHCVFVCRSNIHISPILDASEVNRRNDQKSASESGSEASYSRPSRRFRDPYFGDSPEATRDMATHGWRAPEQHNDAPEDRPPNMLTNVYQIGLSILSLMTLQQPAFESTFENPEPLPDDIFPESPSYPEALLDLAWDCIEWLPDDRPRPEKLYMSIRRMAMDYPLGGSHQIPWRKLLES